MNNILLLIYGLALGSFINALVWRIHEQSRKMKKKYKENLSILHGRSMCPSCNHTLSVIDLIPLISWVFLRGKCRYCAAPISTQYPLVEVMTAALFIFSYGLWPYELIGALDWVNFGLWLIILVILIALFIYDLRWMLLPDRLVKPLTVLVILFVIINVLSIGSDWKVIASIFAGGLFMYGLFSGLYSISKGRWIGGGDVKIAFALGCLSGGFVNSLMVVFIASLLGTLIALPGLTNGKLKASSKLPFGPFLIVATYIALMFGSSIFSWYNRLLLG